MSELERYHRIKAHEQKLKLKNAHKKVEATIQGRLSQIEDLQAAGRTAVSNAARLTDPLPHQLPRFNPPTTIDAKYGKKGSDYRAGVSAMPPIRLEE